MKKDTKFKFTVNGVPLVTHEDGTWSNIIEDGLDVLKVKTNVTETQQQKDEKMLKIANKVNQMFRNMEK